MFEGLYTYPDKSQRPVAVKCIKKSILAEFGPDFIEKLESELRVLSQLKHRYIVEYVDFVSSKNFYYFVFELCQSDLKHLLTQKKRLTEFEAQRIFHQLAQALTCLHVNSIVHRDLKPANVLLSQDNKVKLADFGLARTFAQGEDLMRTRVGTPYYLAPEILEG